jgi:hypothetical protein
VIELPRPVADLCAALGAQAGVEAVTLGGSRAAGTADEASDWDIGLYYRRRADLRLLAGHGEVHPPGSLGGIMNGGAWLTLDWLKVDVMLRDLDVASYWTGQARAGRYEIDAPLGDVAGAVGQAARAVIETAHALACRRRRWVLNEKALIERMGLEGLHGWFTRVPASPAPLLEWVSGLRSALAAAW